MRTRRIVPRSVAGLLCVALVVVLGAAGASPALAQNGSSGMDPPLWFQFNVGSVDPDRNTSHVSVTLREQAACGSGFTIFAGGAWSYWGTPDEADCMGAGTDIGHDMHMWAGELVPGAYFVRVGYGAQPECVLGVSGQAVDYVGVVDLGWNLAERQKPAANPAPVTVNEAPAPAPAIATNPIVFQPQKANPAPVAPVAIAAPAAPAQPATPREMKPNGWMPVTSNEPTMFKFYVGNVPGEQSSHVSVTLYGAPIRAGCFEIYTAEGVPFAQPEQDDWFGMAIMEDGENPSWTGDLVPGAYYVRVSPQGMKNCLLAVSGAGVSF